MSQTCVSTLLISGVLATLTKNTMTLNNLKIYSYTQKNPIKKVSQPKIKRNHKNPSFYSQSVTFFHLPSECYVNIFTTMQEPQITKPFLDESHQITFQSAEARQNANQNRHTQRVATWLWCDGGGLVTIQAVSR